jgi:hypothetical protein
MWLYFYLTTAVCPGCLKFILETYGSAAQIIRKRDVKALETRKAYTVSQDLWYPTVQAIRAHHVLVNEHEKERLRNLVLQTWLAFGKQLGFHERVEERRHKKLAEREEAMDLRPLSSVPGARSCGWKECLCSWDGRPPHRMRKCKGCWKAWYCSTKCQKRSV